MKMKMCFYLKKKANQQSFAQIDVQDLNVTALMPQSRKFKI